MNLLNFLFRKHLYIEGKLELDVLKNDQDDNIVLAI